MRRLYKSRNGCLRCKKRRVKCDENRPCAACVKHNVPCSLGVAVSAASSPVSSPSTHPNPSSDAESSFSGGTTQNLGPRNALRPLRPLELPVRPCVAPPPLLTSDSVPHLAKASDDDNSDSQKRSPWITDLELMHHWSTVTCFTLPRGEELSHIWQVECVRLALTDEPFMHQILAISAFHMAYLQPSHRRLYLMLASQHHGDALQGLREKFTHEVTPESSSSTFAAAALLVIGAFATFAVSNENEENSSPGLQDMLDMFGLLRGMNVVLETWTHTIHQGRFADLFADYESSRPMIFLEAICEKLRNMKENTENDEQTSVISREITNFIDSIKQSIRSALSPEIRLVMLWPINAHPDFLLLLQQRDTKAMALLAYYCAILHETQSYAWYCTRWGVNVAKDIKCQTGSSETEAMAWPLVYMGLS
ncbi:hypothetical protein F4859DRAFT_375621 [Xylaria cf. heliscus]|nr:hypothetical protein F4859DRAFT_375621 [Xylaria cf. heliscus]